MNLQGGGRDSDLYYIELQACSTSNNQLVVLSVAATGEAHEPAMRESAG